MPAETGCKSCHSDNQDMFNGEIAIHFPGHDGLEKPVVWVFPRTAICLNCGFSEFIVPEEQLRMLIEGAGVDEDVPSLSAKTRAIGV